MSSPYTGTRVLLGLAWRRERTVIPVSVLALTALSVGSARATLALYPSEESARAGLSGALANPAIHAMYGPVANNRAGLAVFKTVMMGAVLLGVLALVVVRRHTRTDEEEGRFELIGACPIGRRAPLTAALTLAVATSLVAAFASALGLMALGLDPLGSLAFGGAWLIAGLVMTSVAAVAAQLTASSRAAAGLGFAVLGAFFVIRAVGDTNASLGFLSWISPLGWVGQVHSFGANRLWVVAAGAALSVAAVAAAFALRERRDLGSGIWVAHPGPATAAPRLTGVLGLALRLERATILLWCGAYATLGVLVGALATSVAQMSSDPAIRDLLTEMGGSSGSVTDAFFATELAFTAAGAAAAGLTIAVRMAAEEHSGRMELVLATPSSRRRTYAARAGLAWLLPVLLLTVFGLLCGLVAVASGVDITVGALILAAIATLPTVWLLLSLALLLYGFRRQWAGLAWAFLGLALVLGEFGRLLSLPEMVVALSPLSHLAPLPGGASQPMGMAVMTLLAALATGVGLWAFGRRDIG